MTLVGQPILSHQASLVTNTARLLTKDVPAAKSVIYNIARGNFDEFEQYPHRYYPDTDEMKALLATPHGKGVYYMLLQNHKHVGPKNIEYMAVFKSPTANQWFMVTRLKNMPEPQEQPVAEVSGSGAGGTSGSVP